jgi:hypothetical protein
VDKLRVEMKDMHWEYEQQSFPHLHDDGEATCQISDIKIALIFDISSTSIGIPSLSVNNFDISIGKFDLKIKGTKARFYIWAFALFGFNNRYSDCRPRCSMPCLSRCLAIESRRKFEKA